MQSDQLSWLPETWDFLAKPGQPWAKDKSGTPYVEMYKSWQGVQNLF